MAKGSVVFIASQTLPRSGMERALELLTAHLCRDWSVRVHVLKRQQDDHGFPVPVSRIGGPTRARASMRELRSLLKDLPMGSVVVAVGIWAAIPTLIANVGIGRVIVVWEHSMLPAKIRSDRGLQRLSRLVPALYPLAAEVVCVSDAVRDTVRKRSPRTRTSTVANFLNPGPVTDHPSANATASQSCRMAFVGALRRIKNFELILQAMPYLPDDFTLHVLGDGEMGFDYRRMAESLNVSQRVQWHGHVPDAGTALIDLGVDVVVHPSWGETFGYSLFEAAEIGIPVIALDAPVMNEIIPREVPGRLSTATPEDFASAVLEVHMTPVSDAAWAAAESERRARYADAVVHGAWEAVLMRAVVPR